MYRQAISQRNRRKNFYHSLMFQRPQNTVSLGPEPAQQITTKTYKLNVSLQLPSDTSNISGADIVLYDDQGNVLQTWYGKTIADFGTGGLILTKTGILSDSGKIVVTWLDLNGNDLKDQTIDVQFQEE